MSAFGSTRRERWRADRPPAPWTRRPGTPTPCGRNCAGGAHTLGSSATAPREILTKNAFHASLEAAKSLSDRLRQLTGEQTDGSQLVDAVLMPGATGTPRVAVNTGTTPTETREQKWFAMLIKVAGQHVPQRNPTAHDPRRNRPVTDEELLELLTALSMVHRRLDHARVQP